MKKQRSKPAPALREEIVQALLRPEVREVLCDAICDRLASRILAGRPGDPEPALASPPAA